MLTEGLRAVCGHKMLFRDRFVTSAEEKHLAVLDDERNKTAVTRIPMGYEPMGIPRPHSTPLTRRGWEDALARDAVTCVESFRISLEYEVMDGVLGAVCEHHCERTGLRFLYPGRCAQCPCGSMQARQDRIEEAVRSNYKSSELMR